MIIHKHRELLDAIYTGKRYIVLQGGTRSGKTYSVLMYLVVLCLKYKRLRVSAVSVNAPHLKRGIITDLNRIVIDYDVPATVLAYGVKFHNGSIITFEHYDAEFKARGASRDITFINEANLIDLPTFTAIDTRTRYRTIIDFNPVAPFWVHDKIVDLPNAVLGKSTYRDNPYLSTSQIEAIEANKDNAQWWRVFGEGEIGEMSNQVLRNWQVGSYEETGTQVIGLDFGFSNSPTAAVLVAKDDTTRKIYAKELVYTTGLTNGDIFEHLKEYRHIPVIADSAEPKSIEELRRLGLNIKPASKDVLLGISEVNRYVKVLQGANLINEAKRYSWKVDDAGNPTNAVEKKFDHLMDALRYAVATKQNRGWYL